MKRGIMPRIHCFEPNLSLDQTEALLDCGESHHLVRVLRAKPGDRVVLLNGQGLVAEGVLKEASSRAAFVRITQVQEFNLESPSLKLALGMPKSKTVDTIVRQATELGVAGIHFFKSQRSEVTPKILGSKDKLEKCNRVAVEACKQSGNPFLPVINLGGHLNSWMEGFSESGVHFMAHPKNIVEVSGFSELAAGQKIVWLLVGPEGGLTDCETALALERGFRPVNLGSIVLRVETACVALAALAKGLLAT